MEKSVKSQRVHKSERLEQTTAEAPMHKHTVITLTAQDSIAFADALLNPCEPNAALRAAFTRYDEEATDRD